MADRPRALVADDDAGIRILVSRILTRNGFDVDTARDGAEAIERILEHDYAVTVLDLMMPRLDGFRVATYLKAHRPDLLDRVIVTTAFGTSAIKEIQPLVDCCVEKPFDLATLAEKVKSIMARQSRDQASERSAAEIR